MTNVSLGPLTSAALRALQLEGSAPVRRSAASYGALSPELDSFAEFPDDVPHNAIGAASFGSARLMRELLAADEASVLAECDKSGNRCVATPVLLFFLIVVVVCCCFCFLSYYYGLAFSALHWAALRGGLGVVRVLVDHGAKVCFFIYAFVLLLLLLLFLLKQTFNCMCKCKSNQIDLANESEAATPVHWAAIGGRVRSLHLLVCAGGNLHAVDKRGYNALLHAAQQGHMLAVHYALHKGVPLDWFVDDLLSFSFFQFVVH